MQRKLRVGIFNACRGWHVPHPAAISCLTALTQTPWFHSKAVARLLNSSPPPARGHRSPLTWLPPVEAMLVQADEVCSGRLCLPNGYPGHGLDVLIVPGGSTRADLRVLGKEGREKILKFVRSGGGYCGICAGAFLGLKHLKMVEARSREGGQAPSEDTGCLEDAASGSDDDGQADEDGKKGAGSRTRDPLTVSARFSKLGRRLLWAEARPKRAEAEEAADGSISMRYHNGPLVQVPEGATSRTLCRMWPAAEAADKAPPALSGAAAIVMQNFGGGRALIISPHPESTQEAGFGPEPGKVRLRRILQRAVLLAAAGTKGHSWIEQELHVSD